MNYEEKYEKAKQLPDKAIIALDKYLESINERNGVAYRMSLVTEKLIRILPQ